MKRCKDCRYWSEMIAMAIDARGVVAYCLAPENRESGDENYKKGNDSCDNFLAGRGELGAVDDPMYKDSGWKYYTPDYGETKEDAHPVMVYEWKKYIDAEVAAEIAAEANWDNGGYENGEGDGPDVVVISPDGKETRFSVNSSYSVYHSVMEVGDGR